MANGYDGTRRTLDLLVWFPVRLARQCAGALRFLFRLPALLLWSGCCWLMSVAALALRPLGPARIDGLRGGVTRVWARGICVISGMRIEVRGDPPSDPFFLVSNHICLLDGFAVQQILKCNVVAMRSIKQIPFFRTIIGGLNPVYVHRHREDTPRARAHLEQVLDAKQSIYMCPEAVISPGNEVRRFRTGLLAVAAERGLPVHHVAVTYRTPNAWGPPSRCLPFGPDPYYLTEEGKIPEEIQRLWPQNHSMFMNILRLLCIPGYTVVLTFGCKPVCHGDKWEVASLLREETAALFTPIQ